MLILYTTATTTTTSNVYLLFYIYTGRKGKSNTSSSDSSSNTESSTPICRLSRPGSSIVRVIPPLRGLERQFRCSWCNIALFTTANIVRTDIEYITNLLEAFSSSLPKQSEHNNKQAVSIDKFRSVIWVLLILWDVYMGFIIVFCVCMWVLLLT